MDLCDRTLKISQTLKMAGSTVNGEEKRGWTQKHKLQVSMQSSRRCHPHFAPYGAIHSGALSCGLPMYLKTARRYRRFRIYHFNYRKVLLQGEDREREPEELRQCWGPQMKVLVNVFDLHTWNILYLLAQRMRHWRPWEGHKIPAGNVSNSEQYQLQQMINTSRVFSFTVTSWTNHSYGCETEGTFYPHWQSKNKCRTRGKEEESQGSWW